MCTQSDIIFITETDSDCRTHTQYMRTQAGNIDLQLTHDILSYVIMSFIRCFRLYADWVYDIQIIDYP